MLEATFTLPDDDADQASIDRAIERLNAIRFTVDQFERGVAVRQAMISSAATKIMEGQKPAADESAWTAFCEAEGLLPADVAAHALSARYEPILEALAGFYDIQVEDPEYYQALITEPLTAEGLGYVPAGADVE